MAYHLRLSDLANMSVEEKARELQRLTDAANNEPNGQRAVLDSRIRHYELRYEMTSAELLDRLSRNQIRETAEIADWLFLIQTRNPRVAGKAPA